MATYVFECRSCGAPFESSNINTQQPVFCCPMPALKRNYRAEGVGIAVSQLKAEREHGGRNAIRDMFLETAEEAAGPGDPDGSKAIEEWNENFAPAEGNTKPLRPERPLHSRKVL